MPYSNIVFVKLFLELFDEDDRFLYQLNERQQLLYIKFLYLAGRQKNKISKNPLLIIQKLNYQGTPQDLTNDIKAIKKVFPNFRETRYYYTFMKFNELHNYIPMRKSQGNPEERQRTIPDKEKDKDKDKDKEPHPSDIKLAQLLYDLIKKNTPNWYHKPNLNDWADEIRKLREIDKQPVEVIEKVIKWCQDDDFWYKNILSTAKLRKQFPKLLVQMNEKKKVPFDYVTKKAKETEEYFKKLNQKL